MFKLDPTQFEPPVDSLLQSEPLCPLGPGEPNEALRNDLAALTADTVLRPRTVEDGDMAKCCISGLWLLHNFLDESHKISQDIPTATGSYWHGIMHRREPDFSNSKYWFRRVGDHEIFAPLREGAVELAESEPHDVSADFLAKQSSWDPFRFIDLCEAAYRGRSANEQLCRQVARLEWRLLFDFCVRKATSE